MLVDDPPSRRCLYQYRGPSAATGRPASIDHPTPAKLVDAGRHVICFHDPTHVTDGIFFVLYRCERRAKGARNFLFSAKCAVREDKNCVVVDQIGNCFPAVSAQFAFVLPQEFNVIHFQISAHAGGAVVSAPAGLLQASFPHCTTRANVQQLRQRVDLAVGSGTITDITRFASFSARNPFISLPTAPSLDAYASAGAALTMGGFKLTVPGQAPVAIFADLQTLREASREMVAVGFGDVLGKHTSLADWRLGVLLLKTQAGIGGRLTALFLTKRALIL